MVTRVVTNDQQRNELISLIKSRPLPITVNIRKGKDRTVEQNRTQRLWLNEAAEQLGDRTAEELRGYCKLHGGVPILREEDEFFREKYDRIIKPRTYEEKLELMQEPFDFPVTRLMTTKQFNKYYDWMWTHFTAQGVVLTEPNKPPR